MKDEEGKGGKKKDEGGRETEMRKKRMLQRKNMEVGIKINISTMVTNNGRTKFMIIMISMIRMIMLTELIYIISGNNEPAQKRKRGREERERQITQAEEVKKTDRQY